MEQTITIDKETFKALAADTRVKILKFLDMRRHTQSELSASLNLSVPTVKEHLDALEKAKLVSKIEEGYKWKYYELTEKAKCVLDPERKKVWIVLSLLILSVASGIMGMFVKGMSSGVMAKAAAPQMLMEKAMDAAPVATSEAVEAARPFPWLEVIFAIIVVVLAGLLIYYLKRSRVLRKRKH
jgi:DNA-binding transcriptional ArsR family regulator